MLEYEEAVARVLTVVPAPKSEQVQLTEAGGRVLIEPVTSPLDLPPFDNSAMDGYAVRAADVAAAKPDSPVRLRIKGKILAGAAFKGELLPHGCMRIFTGSPLPRGADAVVMQEDTKVEETNPDEVQIFDAAKPWENVRLRGEDVKRGAILVEAGEFLTAGRLSLLAAVGLNSVKVGPRPVVGLLATGSELREPGNELQAGQIYESNRIGVAALIRRSGAEPKTFPLVPDLAAETRQALATALDECDAVVTSGGVSVGEMDLVKAAFQDLGGQLEFWRVAIKPGRPFVFGRCREKLLFGLPGNPVSALVTFLLLVRPALLRWQGAARVGLPSQPALLAEPLVNRGERRHFVRVKFDAEGKVRSAGVQASHFLSSFAAAEGLVNVPGNSTLAAGSLVQVLRWE